MWNGIEPAQLDGGTAEGGRGGKQDTITRLAFAEIKKNCRCLIFISFCNNQKAVATVVVFGIKSSGALHWNEFLTDCKLRLQDDLTVT